MFLTVPENVLDHVCLSVCLSICLSVSRRLYPLHTSTYICDETIFLQEITSRADAYKHTLSRTHTHACTHTRIYIFTCKPHTHLVLFPQNNFLDIVGKFLLFDVVVQSVFALICPHQPLTRRQRNGTLILRVYVCMCVGICPDMPTPATDPQTTSQSLDPACVCMCVRGYMP
jgi:hypothetical protein